MESATRRRGRARPGLCRARRAFPAACPPHRYRRHDVEVAVIVANERCEVSPARVPEAIQLGPQRHGESRPLPCPTASYWERVSFLYVLGGGVLLVTVGTMTRQRFSRRVGGVIAALDFLLVVLDAADDDGLVTRRELAQERQAASGRNTSGRPEIEPRAQEPLAPRSAMIVFAVSTRESSVRIQDVGGGEAGLSWRRRPALGKRGGSPAARAKATSRTDPGAGGRAATRWERLRRMIEAKRRRSRQVHAFPSARFLSSIERSREKTSRLSRRALAGTSKSNLTVAGPRAWNSVPPRSRRPRPRQRYGAKTPLPP